MSIVLHKNIFIYCFFLKFISVVKIRTLLISTCNNAANRFLTLRPYIHVCTLKANMYSHIRIFWVPSLFVQNLLRFGGKFSTLTHLCSATSCNNKCCGNKIHRKLMNPENSFLFVHVFFVPKFIFVVFTKIH